MRKNESAFAAPCGRRTRGAAWGLLLLGACSSGVQPPPAKTGEDRAAVPPPTTTPKDKRPPQPKPDAPPPPPLETLPGSRLTGEGAYDNQPAVAVAADGTPWVVWVRYRDRGADELVACAVKDGAASPPVTLSPAPGQYVRPVLAAAGGDLWCFWTSSEPDRVASIWFSRRAGGAWTPAARLLPGETRAHQNPEAAAAADGRLAVVYQVHNGADYDIHLRQHDGKSWLPPRALSDASTSDWDPAVAFDARGAVHVAWSGFKDGDYDIYWFRPGKGFLRGHLGGTKLDPDRLRRISARGEYDMHPWLAAAPDGTVWASWDVVSIDRHGRSGGTTITGANRKDGGSSEHDLGRRTLLKSAVEVRVLDGDTVRVPGRPREEIVAPPGYLIAHCALAKVVIGPKGEPWIFHRALHRVPSMRGVQYNWEVVARPFRDGRWQGACRLRESDGYLEEPGLASAAGGILVAYGTEHRSAPILVPGRASLPASPAGPGSAGASPSPAAPPDHHRDFDSRLGWKGDIYIATVGGAAQAGPLGGAGLPLVLSRGEGTRPDTGASGGTGLRLAEAAEASAAQAGVPPLPEAAAPEDARVPERLPRDAGRYEVHDGHAAYRLLWGDTHRHTNVSRCSQGAEPTPDDHYRYGADICRYDFLALSDHAEDPRRTPWNDAADDPKTFRLEVVDYYWWKQQKLADLYHVPGCFSVLYNFEWTLFFPHGHHNTIFASRPTVRLDKFLADSSTLAGGWKVLEAHGAKAITIPHTGADPWMGTAWEVQDDRYQRLCEIFQACRGSYEHAGCPREFKETSNKKGFYWSALEKGYHVGVIASTDHGYGCAYACVYAPANTRDAIWQAMWDRRTYGSTTYGLVLDVRSGDHWMGEEWKSAEAPALDIVVRGAAPIRSVEILGRSKVLHAEGGVKAPLNRREARLRWTDPEWSAQTKEQWYYVRVIQTDDEIAWSSPVWVTPVK